MRTIIVLFFATFLLGGCQSSSSTEQAASSESTINPQRLTIYSHRYVAQDQQLMNTFRVRANKVVDTYLHSGEQIIELAKSGQLQGDMVVLENLYQAHQLKKTGVLSPYNAGTYGEYIPSKYIDNEGYWGAASRWAMSVVYNPNRVDPYSVRTYAGILDTKHKGRIAIAHPDSSGLTNVIGAMMAAYGEQATRTYLNTLNDHLYGPPIGSDWDAISAVVNGQADIAFVNGSEFLRYRNAGNPDLFKQLKPLDFEIPTDAKGNCYFDITPICILNNAPNRNYAINMAEFLTITENQSFYTEAMMEYPVNVFSKMSDLTTTSFNVPQGKIAMEDVENQLDNARALILSVTGL